MSALGERLFMALSTKTSVDGLWVGAFGDDEKGAVRKVREALSLIETYDPVRYSRLRKDLRRVWVAILPGAAGQYHAETDSCHIDSGLVASFDPSFIASVIVHEATHARLRRFGYAEQHRDRLEAACRAQELVFAAKHPGGAAVLDWLRAGEARNVAFSDAAVAQRHREGLEAAALEAGFPAWLVKTLLRFRDFRMRLARARRHRAG